MKKPAYEFAAEVDSLMESFSDKEYLHRTGRAKKVIEELYPLSRLALRVKQPGVAVLVEAFEDSGRADGHIWITGLREANFEVQITYAGYEGEDALRSQLLVQQYFTSGASPVTRDRKSEAIIVSMSADDFDEPIRRLATSIRTRFIVKNAKPYAPGTVLLIAFDNITLRGRGWWNTLYAAIDKAGGVDKGIFDQVYLFNGGSNELSQAA
jgi:hypothetical protein